MLLNINAETTSQMVHLKDLCIKVILQVSLHACIWLAAALLHDIMLLYSNSWDGVNVLLANPLLCPWTGLINMNKASYFSQSEHGLGLQVTGRTVSLYPLINSEMCQMSQCAQRWLLNSTQWGFHSDFFSYINTVNTTGWFNFYLH